MSEKLKTMTKKTNTQWKVRMRELIRTLGYVALTPNRGDKPPLIVHRGKPFLLTVEASADVTAY